MNPGREWASGLLAGLLAGWLAERPAGLPSGRFRFKSAAKLATGGAGGRPLPANATLAQLTSAAGRRRRASPAQASQGPPRAAAAPLPPAADAIWAGAGMRTALSVRQPQPQPPTRRSPLTASASEEPPAQVGRPAGRPARPAPRKQESLSHWRNSSAASGPPPPPPPPDEGRSGSASLAPSCRPPVGASQRGWPAFRLQPAELAGRPANRSLGRVA